MDKKTLKKVSVLRERVQRLNRVLAGVKAQNDEPDEIQRVEAELRKATTELESLLKK